MTYKAFKFIYSRVFIKNTITNKSQVYSLHPLIDEFIKLKSNETIVDVHDYKVKKEEINFYDKRYVHICLMKMSDRALPYKAFADGRNAEALSLGSDEYLGRDTHLIYDMDNMVLMFQNTKEALNDVSLCIYLNELAHKLDLLNEDQILLIKPIIDTNALDPNSKPKKINISFANVRNLNKEKIPTLGNIIEGFNKFGAITGTITISIGHNSVKYCELDNTEIQNLLTELRDLNSSDKECISYARVSYVENGNTYLYDLLDEIMNDIAYICAPPKSAIPFEKISDKMLSLYKNSLPKLEKILNRN